MTASRRDSEQALAVLRAEDCTCVLCRGEQVIRSHQRGVRPLLGWVREGKEKTGFGAADKVVGRAAAFLYVLLKIRELHACVLSIPAKEVLEAHGIPVTYDLLVDRIRNRSGDGFCPMEQAVRDVIDPGEALEKIERTLRELQASS